MQQRISSAAAAASGRIRYNHVSIGMMGGEYCIHQFIKAILVIQMFTYAVIAATSSIGTCTTDEDCSAKVRSRFPSESSAGVGMCQCYAASSVDTFDEWWVLADDNVFSITYHHYIFTDSLQISIHKTDTQWGRIGWHLQRSKVHEYMWKLGDILWLQWYFFWAR